MKKISSYSLYILLAILGCMLCACSDFEPTGYTEVPTLEKASDLKADINGYEVNLSWNLPAENDVEGVLLICNGNSSNPIRLDGRVTTYQIKGQPMEEEYLYTVKVLYQGGYVSEGVSVTATIPHMELANVTELKAEVNGRTVTLEWVLPSSKGITAVKVIRDGEMDAATVIAGQPTSCVLKGQPMDKEITYTVAVVYDEYYASKGTSVKAVIPFITPKMGYLMTATTIRELPDDDERAAAAWFVAQENAELIYPSQLAELDADIYPVLWIEIDRVGLALGWENLPSEITNAETMEALRQYSANGGSLYLANMATQLTVPLGIVPADMAPTVYGNGDGGSGDDVWVINPYLGWDFRNGSDQGFYDRTAHAIYKGLTLEDPNNYGYENLPLIGPGQREDHNCMWDCNIYGKGNYPDVIKNFEVTTNSLVLATWGHVRDHCVAGLVEFYANAEHGRCIANGLAAYEWNQNSCVNPYQHNIEQLTKNILDYLK
ncbi:MAG: DUF4960 domain-containing protein [Muribaculaceae bacterium]|nr:DUF4960 domain-containing protein [Muribaculaceae bacterium]